MLLLNNLIVDNDNHGVHVTDASQRAQIINNTMAGNSPRGVSIVGNSSGAFLRNNVIQDNGNVNIEVDRDASLDGYDADYNLVFDPRGADPVGSYRPTTIAAENDMNADALFVDQDAGDYHLEQAGSPAVDSGDGQIEPLLLSQLFQRSTAPGGEPDAPPVDMGYHYPR